jgi:hypothetical protein
MKLSQFENPSILDQILQRYNPISPTCNRGLIHTLITKFTDLNLAIKPQTSTPNLNDINSKIQDGYDLFGSVQSSITPRDCIGYNKIISSFVDLDTCVKVYAKMAQVRH